jgi:RNA polymerase sigma factor (sigma-70 family)
MIAAVHLRFAPDQRLVEAVNAGSERAFEALFDRHHPHVLAFCRQMLGSFEEAEDAAQLTFLAAYRDLARSERPQALRPWLYGIARHRCLSLLRARRERPVDEVPVALEDHVGVAVARRDELRGVLADLAGLPEDQRVALILAELGDVSHEDIARLLACPRVKVKALVFQARSSLAAAREARETPCAVIRDQLSTLRGGALRRATLRRHVRDCPSCRAFRERLRVRRGRLGMLLPAMPGVGLKRAVLGSLLGSGGGTGLAAALVTVAIPIGAITAALTAWHDSGRTATVEAHQRGALVVAQPGVRQQAPTSRQTRDHRVRPERRVHSRQPANGQVSGAHAAKPDVAAASGPSTIARPVKDFQSGQPAEAAPAPPSRRRGGTAPPPAAVRGKTARTARHGTAARPIRPGKARQPVHPVHPGKAGRPAQATTGQPTDPGKPPQAANPSLLPQAVEPSLPPQAVELGASAASRRAVGAPAQPSPPDHPG